MFFVFVFDVMLCDVRGAEGADVYGVRCMCLGGGCVGGLVDREMSGSDPHLYTSSRRRGTDGPQSIG